MPDIVGILFLDSFSITLHSTAVVSCPQFFPWRRQSPLRLVSRSLWNPTFFLFLEEEDEEE